MGLEKLGKRYRGRGKKHGRLATTFTFHRGMCARCGAWRGAFGLEPTPDLFVEHAVEVFREVRRVLRSDGTLWLNIGDSYATGAGSVGLHPAAGVQGAAWAGRPEPGSTSVAGYRGGRAGAEGKHATAKSDRVGSNRAQRGEGNAGVPFGPMTQPNRMPQEGLKPKDLVGIPWMLAFALRADGWWLRQDIIWQKPNPMPESIEDRCTKAHEYVFLLSKSERYFYDAEAIKEPASENQHPRKAPGGSAVSPKSAEHGLGIKANKSFHAAGGELVSSRNKRSVWTVATAPFPEAHFATFPPELIEPCIKAGTSERGCCPTCGAGFERITAPTERYAKFLGRSYHDHEDDAGKGQMQQRGETRQNLLKSEGGMVGKETETIGWYPDCGCAGLKPLPKHPPSPRREDAADDAEHEKNVDQHRRKCRFVDAARREACAPVAGMKTVPAVVLDPFGGAGTTGLVADRLQRSSVLCELNAAYAEMARRRIENDGGLFSTVAAE